MSAADSYLVLLCAHCHDSFVVPSSRRQTQQTISCPHCFQEADSETYRVIGEHPERAGAVELRSRHLARNADQGVSYQSLPDYGVLGDRLDSREEPLVEPDADTAPALNLPFFEAMADQTFAWCDELFASRAADSLGQFDDSFAAAADRVGVDHPGEEIVATLAEDRLEAFQNDRAEPPMAGGMTLTTDAHLNPAVSLSVVERLPAPTTLQEHLFGPRSQLTEALFTALDRVTDECRHDDGDARQRLVENGVWALDGAYARLAITASAGERRSTRALLQVTQSLGGQTPLNLNSSLDDIRTGPIAVLAAADLTPTLQIEIGADFVERFTSTRRRRFLRHLCRLTPGVDVRIVGSRLALRKLLAHHGDDLPASVSDDAQRHLCRGSASLTERTAQTAEAALDELGMDHPAWAVLESIAQTPSERRAYAALYADPSFEVSDEGIRQRLKRLRDLDLLESTTFNGETHAGLTPAGVAALEKHPSLCLEHSDDAHQTPDSSRGGQWDTEHTSQSESQDSGPTHPSVSDPRNTPNSTVLPQRAHERGDRPGASSTDGEMTSAPSTQFLSLGEHHAIASASSSGQYALVDRPSAESSAQRDRRVPRYSFDDSRDEVVVSVDFSPTIALTAVRLCAALLSDPAFEQVLTPAHLADSPAGDNLAGLDISNPYVLRGAVCLGWLRNVDTTANRFLERLMQARRDLLAKTSDLYKSDGSIDESAASDLLREAHGLMGVALRVYDLLGIDVVREIRFPDGVPADSQQQQALRDFVATASSVGARYGAYSGFRVLHEDRPGKREDLISQPDVDVSDPDGTLLGSWVFTGEDASDLRAVLSESPDALSLQEEGEKFAPFRLAGEIVDGNRRTAVAETVTRLLSFKEGLRPDRQAISVLAAMTSDVVAAGEALMALSGEEEPRELDMQDIQYGMSQLSWEHILPDVGGTVVSKVVQTLVDAQTPLSTAEVADRADCSTRSLASESNERVFNELEALGLLERTDLGEGKATEWRLRLPFRDERRDADPPLPLMLVGRETAPLGTEWRLTDALFEVFARAADEYGNCYEFAFGSGPLFEATVGPPPDRELSRFTTTHTWVVPIVTLIATLLDAEDRLSSGRTGIVFGRSPDPTQVRLQAAVS